jgi:O-antigen/teichoic acid export membrane protein
LSLARHTAYNLAGQLLPLVLSLLTLPLYLRLIGEARFGVLALMWLFVGYMSLFDLGMGQAVARQLSRLDGASATERARVLWTAMSISLGLGLVGALLAAPLGTWFFTHYAPFDDGLRGELRSALPWAASLVPVATLAGVLAGALQARRAFAELNLFGVAANVLVLLAPLGVALLPGVQLAGLAAAVVAARLLVLLLMFWRCRRHYLAGFPASIERGGTLQLLRFGGWTTVSACVGPLMAGFDRFAVGAQLGANAVSHYAIPLQLAERTTMLSVALNHALFPRLASSGSEIERHELGMQAVRVVAAVMAPAVGAALLLSGPFLAWWISPDMAARSTAVAQVLFLAFWINSLALVPYTKLLASGRPDLVAKSHVAELLPYLGLLYFALQAWGLVGVAVAFALRVAADFLLLSHLAGMLKSTLRLLVIPSLLLAATLLIACAEDLAAPWRWALGFGLSVALAGWSVAQVPAGIRRFGIKAS